MEEYFYYLVDVTMVNGDEYTLAVGFLKNRSEWECTKSFSDWISKNEFISVHNNSFDDFNISVRHIISYDFKIQRYEDDEISISKYILD